MPPERLEARFFSRYVQMPIAYRNANHYHFDLDRNI
jgi:hypothetical protein